MSNRAPSPRPTATANALALVTVLALLVAPVCAPLCAAKACSSGAPQDSCHAMPGMSADSAAQFVAAAKTCQASDVAAVLFNPEDKSLSSQRARNAATRALIFAPGARAYARHPGSLSHLAEPGVPLHPSRALRSATILRI